MVVYERSNFTASFVEQPVYSTVKVFYDSKCIYPSQVSKKNIKLSSLCLFLLKDLVLHERSNFAAPFMEQPVYSPLKGFYHFKYICSSQVNKKNIKLSSLCLLLWNDLVLHERSNFTAPFMEHPIYSAVKVFFDS